MLSVRCVRRTRIFNTWCTIIAWRLITLYLAICRCVEVSEYTLCALYWTAKMDRTLSKSQIPKTAMDNMLKCIQQWLNNAQNAKAWKATMKAANNELTKPVSEIMAGKAMTVLSAHVDFVRRRIVLELQHDFSDTQCKLYLDVWKLACDRARGQPRDTKLKDAIYAQAQFGLVACIKECRRRLTQAQHWNRNPPMSLQIDGFATRKRSERGWTGFVCVLSSILLFQFMTALSSV